MSTPKFIHCNFTDLRQEDETLYDLVCRVENSTIVVPFEPKPETPPATELAEEKPL